jgi:hypothetical protein
VEVVTIVPLAPTATQFELLGHEMPFNTCVVGFCGAQVAAAFAGVAIARAHAISSALRIASLEVVFKTYRLRSLGEDMRGSRARARFPLHKTVGRSVPGLSAQTRRGSQSERPCRVVDTRRDGLYLDLSLSLRAATQG